MADDAVGLLDHLGVRRAHVVGASMGGMIAQTMAIEHPDRVLSLVSIMSNEGGRVKGQPTLAAYRVLLQKPPQDRDGYADHTLKLLDVIGSPGFPRDDAEVRKRPGIAFDRGLSAAGTGRQMMAIVATANRTPGLKGLQVPTTVIHGSKDRLVRKSGGKRGRRRRARRALRGDRGHGPRPPARRLAAGRRRDRRERGARGGRLAYCDSAIASTTITISSSTPPPAYERLLPRPEPGVRPVAGVVPLGRRSGPVVVVVSHAASRTRATEGSGPLQSHCGTILA